MFKRIGNTLQVGKSSVPLLDGKHSIYLDTNSLDAYLDLENPPDNMKLIAEYEYDKKKNSLTITKRTQDFSDKKYKYLMISRSMLNNYRVHSGPLYGGNEGDDPISGYIEGLPIDFTYTGFMMSTMAMSLYKWAGGRSCFYTLFFGDLATNKPFYTAIPNAPCADFSPLIAFELAVGFMTFGITTMDAMMRDSLNMVLNRWSIVAFFYNFRRYTDIQINKEEMFAMKLDDKEVFFSPLENDQNSSSVSLPNFNGPVSMFNLMQ